MIGVMPIPALIALDLDGTLLRGDDRISPENERAIRAVLQRGVKVVLVTGRAANVPVELARALGLPTPVICAHGALTIDPATDTVLDHVSLDGEQARELLVFAEEHRLPVAFYSERRFYRRRGTPAFMSDMRPPEWCDVDDLRVLEGKPLALVRALGPHAARMVRERFAVPPLCLRDERWGDFIECAVTHADATKRTALERLCARLGIARERVLAIGDSPNDLPMLRWAGIGVAMGNAPEHVRANADHVTETSDRDGVARALERFVLDGRARKSA